MKETIKGLTKQVLSWGYALQRGDKVQKKVILLGHMRCGSSLMVHILASNPDVAGYGETHSNYNSVEDLEELSTNVYFALRRIRPARFVLDKVLHDEYVAKDEILNCDSCTFPIMAREAISSVSSMVVSLSGWFLHKNPNCRDVLSMAADYYRGRLDTLSRHAEILARRGRCWYFTYNDLLERSAQVFSMLERSLALRQPLLERYEVGPRTGIHGYGDPSVNIKRGYIDRSIARNPMAIPEKLAETLVAHFRSFDEYVRGISECINRTRTGTHQSQ